MSCNFILDTNLLVDYLVGSAAAEVVERLLQVSLEGMCCMLLPELIIDIECRRVLSRMIVTKHITSDEKLRVLVNMLKYIREQFEGFNCKIVDTWDAGILRRAAAIYHRLSKDRERDGWERRHQDLIVWATAEKHNAVLITRDSDFKKLWEKLKRVTVYYIGIDDKKFSIEKLGQSSCTCVESALKEICANSF